MESDARGFARCLDATLGKLKLWRPFDGNDAGLFQGMLQFADVARPVVVLLLLHAGQRQPKPRSSQLSREAVQKVLGKQRNFFDSLSQGRQFHREDAQAVV